MLDEELSTRRWSGQPVEIGTLGNVILRNAAIDAKGDELIAHGWLDLESINLVRVDSYQREILGAVGGKSTTSLQKAVEAGVRLPDIMLGMRGDSVNFPKGSNDCKLLDSVYVIDGLQRIFALKYCAERNPEVAKTIRVGAEVRFATTKESETELFNVLNTRRIPVSPNIIMRNLRDDSPGVMTLFGLSGSDKDFALYRRVCWNQRMVHGEIITAMMLGRVAHAIHSKNRGGSSRPEAIATLLDGDIKRFKMNTFRANIVEFYEILDACYGVRTIELGRKITHMRANFMIALARILADHENFWRGSSLHVDAPAKKKLASFPINDPEISRLAGTGSSAVLLIENYLREHFNSGKRTNRLVERSGPE